MKANIVEISNNSAIGRIEIDGEVHYTSDIFLSNNNYQIGISSGTLNNDQVKILYDNLLNSGLSELSTDKVQLKKIHINFGQTSIKSYLCKFINSKRLYVDMIH